MSADEAEAARCLRELAVPFFHHEVVKQALLLAMEQPAVQAPLLALLAHMAESGLVSGSQMQKAWSRCYVLSKLFVKQVKLLLAGRVAAGAARTYLVNLGCCPTAVQEARFCPHAVCPAHRGCLRAAECHAVRLSRVLLC